MSANVKRNPEVLEGEVIGPLKPEDKRDTPQSKQDKTGRQKYALSNPSIVTKSNDLIQKTRYSLPRIQQKLLLAMIAQIDPKHDTDPSKIYSMSFSDFSKLTGVNMASRSYLSFIKKTVKELADSSFWMDGKSIQDDEDRLIRWVGEETTVNRKTKTIKIQFSKNIFPYLTQLKSNYTSFNVEYLLQMNSTYSMRFYEILLSYDNGDTDYGYTNGIVFQPVTDEILNKFPDKAPDIEGFMYKVFDIQELKEQLSPAPDRDRGSKSDPKERPLTEKYANFTDFERNVLKIAKNEINTMTDLWFDYIPVRIAGSRSYQRIYLFIKYKTNEEMQYIKDNCKDKSKDIEIPRKGHRNPTPVAKPEKANNQSETPASVAMNEGVYSLSVTKAVHLLESRANYEVLKTMVSEELAATIQTVYVYTARLLTNTSPKKVQIAHDTRDALNRIVANNGDLKAWSVGMAMMLDEKKEAGLLKTPQYNSMIVFNAIEDLKVITDGKKKLELLGNDKFNNANWMSAFDD